MKKHVYTLFLCTAMSFAMVLSFGLTPSSFGLSQKFSSTTFYEMCQNYPIMQQRGNAFFAQESGIKENKNFELQAQQNLLTTTDQQENQESNFQQDASGVKQNAFNILRQTNQNGEILLAYIFPVNTQPLLEKGFSAAQVATYKFYLATYVGALASQQKNKQVQGVQVSGATYFSDVDGIGFSMIFEDSAAQKRFLEHSNTSGQNSNENGGNSSNNTGGNSSNNTGGNSSNNGNENNTTTENAANDNVQVRSSGFFIKKVEYQTKFPVSSTQAAENFMSVCTLATTAWCNGSKLNKDAALSVFENPLFVYDSVSTTDTLQSDTFFKAGGLCHNVFAKSLAEIQQNPTITFYATYPNTAVWYAAAVVLSALAMLATFLALKFVKLSKRSAVK